jgi:hypothetical protein
MPDMISSKEIEKKIYLLRDQRVMIDRDLAELYGVETKVLNQALKRNIDRFPDDFIFQLTKNEFDALRSQFVTSNRGGSRYLPYAFTEHGILMLSSILNSSRAIQVNIQIMRVFISLRKMIQENRAVFEKLEELKKELARLDKLEHRQDTESKAIWNAVKVIQKELFDLKKKR